MQSNVSASLDQVLPGLITQPLHQATDGILLSSLGESLVLGLHSGVPGQVISSKSLGPALGRSPNFVSVGHHLGTAMSSPLRTNARPFYHWEK